MDLFNFDLVLVDDDDAAEDVADDDDDDADEWPDALLVVVPDGVVADLFCNECQLISQLLQL